MSNKLFKFSLIYLIVIISLTVSLAYPSPVLADDGLPPLDPAAENADTDSPVTEEVVTFQGDVLGNSVTEITEVVDDSAEGNVSESSVVELVESINDAGVVLADENGDPLPLATVEVQDALLLPDPIGCPAGVQPVTWGGTGIGCTASYLSIQAAIDDVNVAAGWTIYIDPGTFNENVNVNKSITLQGSGVGVTIIHPGAASTPSLGCGAGSCASTSNTVFYITADNVTIRDLTIDGDNPFVTSGTVVNGTDINARNGIFGNSVDNLVVENTEIENIYLRGIQVSYGSSFEIRDNTMHNVDGSLYSISIFNYSGGGVIEGNIIDGTGDGIASNWSTGTQVLNNTISNMGTGIHTDNAQASDVISGNTISNGGSNSYGIFVFAPYAAVSVTNNDITNVDYGLTVSGNGWGDSLNTITFDGNNVDTNVAGAYVTTDVWGYFFSDVSASFTNNVFTGGDYGFYLEANGAGEYYTPGNYDCSGAGGDCMLYVSGSGNSITGQNLFAATIAAGQPSWTAGNPLSYYGIYDVDLSGNWWGDASGPNDATVVPDGCGITLDNPAGLGGDVSECIFYDLWLTQDPFAIPTPPTPPNPPAPVDDEKNPVNRQGPAVPFIIPVTGGLIDIDCETESAVLYADEVKVTLTGLCGYQIMLETLTNEVLPAKLGVSDIFLFGVNINLLKDGTLVDKLPSDAKVVISFPSNGSVMKLNSIVNSWQEIQGKDAAGQVEVDAGPGIFILVER